MTKIINGGVRRAGPDADASAEQVARAAGDQADRAQAPLRVSAMRAHHGQPETTAVGREHRRDRTGAAVEVSHLRKTYGPVVAVDDVSFSVREGEIFGVLGPNGAGKTTTVECVIGLRTPDAGAIRVMGLDPRADHEELHAILGVQLQASALPGRLRACLKTGGEAVSCHVS